MIERVTMPFNSQKKGKVAELDTCAYLTACGLKARRHRRGGDRTEQDEGDIRIPGVTFEVKHWDGDLSYGSVQTFLRKLELQRGEGNLGVLVERLDGIAAHRAGEWNAWMTVGTLSDLLNGTHSRSQSDPVCLKLSVFVTLWKSAGRAVLTNPFELTS